MNVIIHRKFNIKTQRKSKSQCLLRKKNIQLPVLCSYKYISTL